MQKDDIIKSIKEIVTPYVQNKEGLKDFDEETEFIKDLEINSANLVDVILDVEDEFDIMIDNDSMNGMLKVKDAYQIVQQKLEAK